MKKINDRLTGIVYNCEIRRVVITANNMTIESGN